MDCRVTRTPQNRADFFDLFSVFFVEFLCFSLFVFPHDPPYLLLFHDILRPQNSPPNEVIGLYIYLGPLHHTFSYFWHSMMKIQYKVPTTVSQKMFLVICLPILQAVFAYLKCPCFSCALFLTSKDGHLAISFFP